MTDLIATQVCARVLVGGNGGLAVTQMTARALALGANEATMRVTQMNARAVVSNPEASLNVTQMAARALAYAGPDFRWVEMFHEIRFPEDISWGSEGGPGYLTDLLEVRSGNDQTIERWDNARYQYDVSFGVQTLDQLHALHSLFHVMGGRAGGCRYKDWLDYTSTLATTDQARSPPPISSNDQLLGEGDNTTVTFNLRKLYEYDGHEKYRRIYKPVAGTTIVAVDGEDVTNWTIDTTTGVITFISRITIVSDAISCTVMNTDGTEIMLRQDGTDGSFEGFAVGERILTTGWADDDINTLADEDWYVVQEIATDGSYLILYAEQFGTGFRINQAAGSTVTVRTHPAPDDGLEVTAGFEFDVPVRFMTDQLPTKLDAYGIGSINSIPLTEIRITVDGLV